MALKDQLQTADWKSEKHVPVIECPDAVQAGELFEVKVSIGKEVAHPNTTEHHIMWIGLFFKPEDDNSTYDIGQFAFNAHGASVRGANTGPVYTHHGVTVAMRTDKPGTLYASSYCNIHGLWEGSKEIRLAS